ncbi:MAG TPA: sugar ABC transporter ATP-binding protein [Bauldia sp.]|nr:sugar ABC transporter ATP-binding protein [Bauldia sp.]
MAAPLLALSGVSKAFGTTQALAGVSFDLYPGEVHALVGENGAGKSTLLAVLTGVVTPDSGTIAIDGKHVTIDGPARAQALGIGTVFQELSLAGSLTVAENIFAGRLPTMAGFVRWKELRRRAREVLGAFGMEIPVDRTVDSLPAGARQLVEIAKALSLDSRILLLDEPTSALTNDEVEALLGIVARLKARGMGVVYVSHKLSEVFRIADRITVLRDGCLVGTRPAAATSVSSVVRDMVGRDLAPSDEDARRTPGAIALKARGLSRHGEFADIDLELRSREIVGLAGLVGSRRTELARTLGGLAAPHSGAVEVRGSPIRFGSPRDAMALGVVYVPDDRKSEGLFLSRSVMDNAVVTTLRRLSRFGVINAASSRMVAHHAVDRFRIKARGIDLPAGSLSGGNQQKLMLAKWLATNPGIVIVNEPTKGVDIEAKREIHNHLRRLAEAGAAILAVSSDLLELLAISDRIVIMREGRVVGTVGGRAATEEEIMRLAAGAGHHGVGEAA